MTRSLRPLNVSRAAVLALLLMLAVGAGAAAELP
jgi:hypothetical protein